MKDLVIFGAGGLGRMAYRIASDINKMEPEWNVVGFLDDNQDLHGELVDGLPVLGDGNWIKNQDDSPWVIIAVARSEIRRLLSHKISDCLFATLVHPLAWISPDSSLGEGSIIYPGVMIDINVNVGSHVFINKNATIGHDTVIEDYVTISPGVNIGGNVVIGRGCDLGINSCTVQGVGIGEWSVIGAGAAVTSEIPANVVAVGVPARAIKKRPAGWYMNI